MTGPLQRLLILFDGRRHDRESVLVSFGVMNDQGEMYFVRADRVEMDGAGRLAFRAGTDGEIVAAVAAGKWERVLKGISMDDVKAAHSESVVAALATEVL